MAQTFYLPVRIIQGNGCLAQIGEVTAEYGKKALLVCGRAAMRASGILERAQSALLKSDVTVILYDQVSGEPTLEVVQGALDLARAERCEVVIGLGGGSAMDVAKAVAGLYALPGAIAEYHAGRKLESPGLPLVTIPTTAGTGAEVTNNAVLTDPVRGIKTSIRSEWWFPRVALVDPELTLRVPPAVTAASGGDALCQALEAYVSVGAMPVSDALCERAIHLLGRSLVRAYEQGDDLGARADMLYGSLMAGMCLATARLGAVHGMAHSLGFRYNIAHGVICALLLPHVMECNLDYATAKYACAAALLGADTAGLSERQAARQAVEAIRAINARIGIPQHLREFGVRPEQWPAIIAESLAAGSTKFNPRVLAAEDIRLILEKAS